MIVVDASAVVTALTSSGPQAATAHRVLLTQQLHAPQLLKAESVASVRNLALRGVVPSDAARRVVDRIGRLPVVTSAIEPLLERVWELRATVTVYDAWYVALAERLRAPLVTADQRLAEAPGPECEFVVI